MRRSDPRVLRAAESSDIDLMTKLLGYADLTYSEVCGNQAIHIAAERGDQQIVPLLLDHGVPIDSEDSEGCTATFHAADSNQLPMIRYLVAQGANLEH